MSHAESGINIVNELASQNPTRNSIHLSHNPYIPLSIFDQLLGRLDAQIMQIGFTHRRRLDDDTSSKGPGYQKNIPSSFYNLAEARNSLDWIRTRADQMAQALPFFPPTREVLACFTPEVIAETKLSYDLIRNASAVKLKQWSSAFESFLKHKQAMTAMEERAAHILILQRLIQGVHLSIDFFLLMDDETVWDGHYQEFEEIVTLSEVILRLSPSGKPTFTLDTEILMPLVSALIKCRDGQVRRRGIALLRSSNRQEGLWNSLLTANIVERMMEIEEEGLEGEIGPPESIPVWNRLCIAHMQLDSETRRANFLYAKPGRDGKMVLMDESVEWAGVGAQ
jgi:hypothetical protein